MNKFNMFITAVCVLFLIKLRWPKNKSISEGFRDRVIAFSADSTSFSTKESGLRSGLITPSICYHTLINLHGQIKFIS